MTHLNQTVVVQHLKLCSRVWRMMQRRLSMLLFSLHVNENRQRGSKGRDPAPQHEALAAEYCSMLYKGKNWHLECQDTAFW